ncbi:synapse differentiation-inducing gene protein 1-like [Microcaecilia unicolor]|uniref:Synapse differentiation-inducing gene protein 1-like n=1 Tax=Microcaecilia unicolor TaxID=1415580 RepID=A0A6P7ZUC9_9AMPH|nr:synapse differentiation-inducing gene protein 1-like [Microcaecilia unicolor]
MESGQRNIPSYLALSIFNVLACCFPLGVIALVCSLRVENASGTGDFDRAANASRLALILNIVGILVGFIIIVIVIVIFVLKEKESY